MKKLHNFALTGQQVQKNVVSHSIWKKKEIARTLQTLKKRTKL